MNDNTYIDSFSKGASDKKGADGFKHECNEVLLEQTKEKLAKSETGRRLLEIAGRRNVRFTTINNKETSVFVENKESIIISAPVTTKELPLKLVLELGAAIRDIELRYIGYDVPKPDDDPIEYANSLHTREIDKVVYRCAIAHELNKNNDLPEILEEIKKLGYIDVYNAYVNEL